MNSTRKLELADIADMRAYEREREALRNEVIEIKHRRRIGLGTVVTIMFENRATIKSQMREWLIKLFGIENAIVFKLSDGSLVRSIAEEGHAETLTREIVTAAVHYLRFEFTPNQVVIFESGGAQILCDLPAYLEVAELPPLMVTELLSDLR